MAHKFVKPHDPFLKLKKAFAAMPRDDLTQELRMEFGALGADDSGRTDTFNTGRPCGAIDPLRPMSVDASGPARYVFISMQLSQLTDLAFFPGCFGKVSAHLDFKLNFIEF